MIIEYHDMMISKLSAIKHVSREVAYEQMSKIGNQTRVNITSRMKSHQHLINQKKQNGKKVLYRGGPLKTLGDRTDEDGKILSKVESMSSFISSFLMEQNGTLVVGGINKAFIPIKRVDGKKTGVLKRQSAVTPQSQSIIHKLDTGVRNRYHKWWGSNGTKGYALWDDGRRQHDGFKGYGFMQDGLNDTRGYMKSKLTTAYDQVVGRAMNKTKIETKVHKKRA